jgi:hypothetical protein
MTHAFTGYLTVRENYFEKPDDLIAMSKDLEYSRSTIYPGLRTQNLLVSDNFEIRNFGLWFADQISINVFPGICQFEVFVCFHKNDSFNDDELNDGWIHADYGNMAGLVYLTPNEDNFNTGTSIFYGTAVEEPTDLPARQEFYLSQKITNEYIAGLRRNKEQFKETIRIGNRFNRLIAYDSKMYHKPNSFSVSNGERLCLLFFVSNFNYDK